MKFKVSVVLATRDRPELLEKCLKSLEGQAHILETIVIDDSGKKPIGCEQARNKGVEQASNNATHLYFTDDDCVVEAGCLARLCNVALWESPFTAAIGGACIVMSKPKCHQKIWRYQTAPMTIDDKGNIVDLSGYYVEQDSWYPAAHLIGGNMLVLKKTFNEVGGLSREYGAGTIRGETDLCLKLREANYRLWFNPSAHVYHFKECWDFTETQRQSDEMWRKKWAPKRFLGHPQPNILKKLVVVGERQPKT